ncbi:MAG: ATP-binding protein [Bacilli bacterium]|nr:ATP-binding protein [Bacilli bacterium]MDD4734139.1 ATP-binding protein [Bacilli bacterium]
MTLKDYEHVESTNIDYKEKLEVSHPKSWLKSVSAFANTKGGILLYGVRDEDKKPVGLEDISAVSSKITELINSKITPVPRYELNPFVDDNKDFLEVNIGDGPATPYYYNSDGRKTAYIRSGDQSIEAPEHMLQSLILKGQNRTFDCLPSEFKKTDVSFTLLEATLKKQTGTIINKDRDYISFNLINTDDYVTNAGLLLCDQGLLRQSRIFCTRWKGTVKGSIDGDAMDDKEYSGSIISLLENAETFIKNNSKTSWEIKGMIRNEFEEYPTKAVREALVNAIIHRDYQILGSEIHVDMYDDRLEITSPGGMVDGSQIQNLDLTKIPSLRRNTIISDFFNRLHFMERRGSGLTRIVESYSDCKKKPTFSSGVSSFAVIFPNKGYVEKHPGLNAENGNVIDNHDYFILKMYKNLGGKVRGNFLPNLENLFDIIGYDRDFSREKVEEIFDVKKSRASDIISKLIDNDLVEYSSESKYRFKK